MKSLIVAIACAGSLAQAAEFTQVQPQQSRIDFAYKQMGVAMDGQFKRFSSTLSFDPAKPANAKAAFDVDLSSIDTGGAESDEEVAGKSWFNTKVFPKASFVSTAVRPLPNNRYEVSGKLSIKGTTQDIVVPASFTPQGKSGVFEGSFTIRRGDFSIGEGPWAKFDIVANDVQVKFRITAHANK